MKKFMNFETLIMLRIIPFLFWIGTAGCIIWSIIEINKGFEIIAAHAQYSETLGGAQVSIGIGIAIIGPVALRILCEFLIIPFYIAEQLQEIKKKLQ